jgi:hypothetical protein
MRHELVENADGTFSRSVEALQDTVNNLQRRVDGILPSSSGD